MWPEGRRATASAEDAIGLELAELAATQPRHCRAPRGPGSRIGGGERLGAGWARSLDFDGIGPYSVGDDVRWIHWRATARSSRVQVRRFAAESHRARMIVADLDPALCFGTRERLMVKTVALIAARLAWEALAAQEPVGLAVDDDPAEAGPRRGKRHVLRLLARLQARYAYVCHQQETQGAVAIPAVLTGVSLPLRRGDEICLVSDFGNLDSTFARASIALAATRTLRAFVVEDPLFRAAPPPGRYPLRHPTTSVPVSAVFRRHEVPATRETIRRLRRERRRRLEDCGWAVEDALDLLPRDRAP